ncbi:predicted protein [Naegleria gruberi]|uniref:Predicted protein n=1 Tax=Naegleria gruberi TaxID=5762 RepID=D2VLX5_NAEGR|nr:uncharacterized protein NAEGRDRAFT_69933 [Naegleria gruberi]EFC42131.1 predicted protein [Naegleria gruberi]|eukprot:XP_002674875.1 predicted protein [Naegleria gruberi strain NEG-M]
MPNIQDYFIFTSNVDGHFAQVFPQEKIAECHGCILYLQCTNSSTCEDIYSVKKHNEFYAETHPETCYPLPVDMESFRVPEKSLPKCIHCGSLARPNIMMFGDYGFVGDRSNEQEDRLRESFIKWREGIDKTKNVENQIHLVTIEIGAGVDVNTVRCESEEKTRKYANIDHVKTTLIRINPTDHQIQQFSIGKGVGIEIPLGGLDALTQIKQRIAELK